MSGRHNPYATTSVPLEVHAAAADTPGSMVYAGFWIRVGAGILDFLILLPIIVLAFAGVQYSRLFYFYYLVPGTLFMGFFYMYLVLKYGGTPGKRLLRLRVVMADGKPVTAKAAVLRNIVELAFSTLSTLSLALAGLPIADADYDPLGWLQKTQLLQSRTPAWNEYAVYVSYAWYAASAIVLLCNVRRRTVHDFLAGTVVIRT